VVSTREAKSESLRVATRVVLAATVVRRVERSRAKQLRLVESTGLAWRTARPNCQENCSPGPATASRRIRRDGGREGMRRFLFYFSPMCSFMRSETKGAVDVDGNLIRGNGLAWLCRWPLDLAQNGHPFSPIYKILLDFCACPLFRFVRGCRALARKWRDWSDVFPVQEIISFHRHERQQRNRNAAGSATCVCVFLKYVKFMWSEEEIVFVRDTSVSCAVMALLALTYDYSTYNEMIMYIRSICLYYVSLSFHYY